MCVCATTILVATFLFLSALSGFLLRNIITRLGSKLADVFKKKTRTGAESPFLFLREEFISFDHFRTFCLFLSFGKFFFRLVVEKR